MTRSIIVKKSKNKLMKIACLCAFSGVFSSVFALMIITDKDINLSKKQGALRGRVVFDNKVYPAIAIGDYKLSSDRKSAAFMVREIKTNNQTHSLSSNPSTIKEVKNAKKLQKGSKLILAGENQEEIAKILGIDINAYKQKGGVITDNGNSSKNGTNGNSATNSGNSGGGNNSYTSPFSSGNGDFSGSSGSYIPSNNGNNSSNVPNPVIVPNGNNTQGDAGGVSNYSAQYCKAPQYDGKNSISLSIVDKDGNCTDLKAQRDDTKCEYRYDFNDGMAIKQTQFYYVDKENQTQNIGGCVDLAGDEYRFPLYKDDSKCKLQVTDNKGYGGGEAWMFQTQILFRGIDGLIHTAADCGDYMNVQEELISYEKDDADKKLKRMVNQYYIDPKTNQKVYINHGIYSPFEFGYQEYACGLWEMDDPNLQAYRRTQIKAYDSVAGSYYDITGCDYSNDGGKSGRITTPYIKLANNQKDGGVEEGDMNGTYEFEIKERMLNSSSDDNTKCNKGYHRWTTHYSNGDLIIKTQWKTTYKTTNTGVTIGYQRPKQDDEKEASIYYTSKRVKTIDRSTIVVKNELGLDADYMKFYEVNENFYKDSDNNNTKQSKEYTDFITKYYRKGKGSLCQVWSVWDKSESDSKCHWTAWNGNYNCGTWNDYIIPTKN
ncbi:hypothetical protein BKH41_01900 [Helicobacter sp. 12S02232-10]|nr:hypothetical protein BKH41_01900 [Helicobacter sp. 12S02232-10]